ncbi:protein C3orf33 homolog isoform X2 [Ptychodera flava]|uniref:protein C3orf33 homolog isoform X2 n=1 Tax=Ptychodera flava TaxID=63121 RepID=UPI003969E98A
MADTSRPPGNSSFQNSSDGGLSAAYVFRKTTTFLDEHIRAIRFSKFHYVKQIPAEFISKSLQLNGRVRSVKNGCLKVEHIPIIDIQSISWIGSVIRQDSNGVLPVYIGGVELEDSAQEFITSHVDKKSVRFRLLRVNEDGGIDCIVTSRKGLMSRKNINEMIVREGHGRAIHIQELARNKTFLKLSQKLIKAEMYAEKKGKGMWIKPTRWQRTKEHVHFSTIKVSTRLESSGSRFFQFLWSKIRGLFRKKDNIK